MKTKLITLTVAAAILLTGVTTSVLAATEESQTQLQAEAKVTKAEAEKTALAKVPNSSVKEAELEREHGKLIWSFDLKTAKSKEITEVAVDAKTGKVIEVKVESPKDEAKEAKEDKAKEAAGDSPKK